MDGVRRLSACHNNLTLPDHRLVRLVAHLRKPPFPPRFSADSSTRAVSLTEDINLVPPLLNVSLLSFPSVPKADLVGCIRRFDVVNRGFSGYNSSQILKIIEHVIPPPSCAKVEFLVRESLFLRSSTLRKSTNSVKLILLGANDSCLPTSPTGQHVPLEKYRENIRKIITDPCVTAHNPTILLVTPPPINEEHLEIEDLKKGYPSITRQQSVTAKYAEVIREISEEFKDRKVFLLDLWAALVKEAATQTHLASSVDGETLLGSKSGGGDSGFRHLLVDGLHLSGSAYALFFAELLPLVDTRMADGHVDSQPWVFP